MKWPIGRHMNRITLNKTRFINSLVDSAVKRTTKLDRPLKVAGSSLFQTTEYFSPAVEANPNFELNDLLESIRQRKLENIFSLEDINEIDCQRRLIEEYRDKLKRIESERLQNQMNFLMAKKSEDTESEKNFRAISIELRSQRNNLKHSLKSVRNRFMEAILKLPNKLPKYAITITPEMVPTSHKNTASSTPLPSGAYSWQSLSHLCLTNRHGQYLFGELARLYRQEMDKMWQLCGSLLNQSTRLPSGFCQLALLSDLARLPAVEASAWPELNSVVQLEATREDVHQLSPESAPTVNPFTRLCLVGSASLPAFTASLFGCALHSRTILPHRLLSFGSVYELSKTNSGTANSNMTSPVSQSTQVSLLDLSPSEEASEEFYSVLPGVLYDFWKKLQPHWPLRIMNYAPTQLRRMEMARSAIVLSTETEDPSNCVTLSEVSLIGQWISRRAQVTTSDGAYPHMVFANVVNFASILSTFNKVGYYTPVNLPLVQTELFDSTTRSGFTKP